MRIELPLYSSLAFLFLVAPSGCARDVIPNTDVEDTAENREVISFVEKYREAVERQDISSLLKLTSSRYLDDNGTPGGDDDMDFSGLREKLDRFRKEVEEVRYEIRYRRVFHQLDKVFVDYTYTASFKVAKPEEGHRWARRLADNRLVLTREKGELRILSGM